MIEWILIIVFTNYQGVTSQAVPFPTQESCIQAGKDSMNLASNVRFSCVQRPIIKVTK